MMMLMVGLQDDGLSAHMPKTLGKKKESQNRAEPQQTVEDDDEYEVEESINDPMMAMMPMSFGKQQKKQDLIAIFAKTKRVVLSISEASN